MTVKIRVFRRERERERERDKTVPHSQKRRSTDGLVSLAAVDSVIAQAGAVDVVRVIINLSFPASVFFTRPCPGRPTTDSYRMCRKVVCFVQPFTELHSAMFKCRQFDAWHEDI